MTNIEFVKKLEDIVANYKTLYVMGCFGAPMNDTNKKRYCNNTAYNKKATRTKMIQAASSDTFGFDCVCLIKGVLWGWNGDTSKTYGGAKYTSNGVPDIGADSIINVCSGVSTNFNNIEVGELVWMKGHVGIYIGDGLAIECTPAWKNNVQITAVKNIGTKKGYNARKWTKHGKLPYIKYEEAKVESITPPITTDLTIFAWQKAAIADGFKFEKYGADGRWGNECIAVAKKAVCKKRITFKYIALTKIVQKAVGVTVDGKFGNDTKKAVMEFQRKHKLAIDGCVGLETWKKILNV